MAISSWDYRNGSHGIAAQTNQTCGASIYNAANNVSKVSNSPLLSKLANEIMCDDPLMELYECVDRGVVNEDFVPNDNCREQPQEVFDES